MSSGVSELSLPPTDRGAVGPGSRGVPKDKDFCPTCTSVPCVHALHSVALYVGTSQSVRPAKKSTQTAERKKRSRERDLLLFCSCGDDEKMCDRA